MRPSRRVSAGRPESEEQVAARKLWRFFDEHKGSAAERELWRHLAAGHAWADARRRVHRLMEQGWLERSADAQVTLRRATGTLRMNSRGFGFVVGDEPPDTFVPPSQLSGALHGDSVAVWVRDNPEGRGPEGRVMAILERGTKEVVGELKRLGGRWFLAPSDERLPDVSVGPSRAPARLEPGVVAVAQITSWPHVPGEAPRGRVVRIVGRRDDPGVDVGTVMAEHQLPAAFPKVVEEAAAGLPDEVRRRDWRGRADLRQRLIVTIDGADAKDLDDAISLEPDGDGWLVGVHIADVTHYVSEHEPLDAEARERGTSVYLVDRVIPMLPEALSNRLASLSPGVPRLTVSAWIRVDPRGLMRGVRFERSVIQTRHRLTYGQVNDILAGKPHALGDVGAWLKTVNQVTEILHERRVERGAVDFDLPEPKVILDDDGRPTDIVVRDRGPAERLIEELMLLANEAVARSFAEHALPGLFRIHEEPAGDRLQDFRTLIAALGYRLPQQIAPKDLQRLLDKVHGTPEERVVNAAMLRAMRQARYSPANLGHFGLATDQYTHFTSPIRRYPDLFTHRVLTAWLGGGLTDAMRADWGREAPQVAEHCSDQERAAMEAERASVLVKQVQFMADKLGQEFDGVISGVQGFGIFVTLDVMVEGMIRVEDLPRDEYRADPIHQVLAGVRSGRSFRLGDPIRVVVARVDERARQISLTLAPEAVERPAMEAKKRVSERPHRHRPRRRRAAKKA